MGTPTAIMKPSASSRFEWLEYDELAKLNQLKLVRIARGEKIYDLSMISPDLPPPRMLIDRLLEASVRQSNQRYSVARGIRKLRDAFAQKYQQCFGVSLDPERNVCVAMGSKDGVVQLLQTLTERGDTVLFGSPTYPVYDSAAKLAELKTAVFTISTDESQMLAQIASLLKANPTIKVIILNFPNNPTGVVVQRSFYDRLIPIARAHGVAIVNDFVYGEMVYGPANPPSLLAAATSGDLCYEVYSLSKAYSVPGWRVGACLGEADGIRRVSRLKSHLDYGIYLPIQIAAASALTCANDLTAPIVEEYSRRAGLLSRGLTELGWKVSAPQGGACIWAEVPSAWSGGLDSFSLSEKLLSSASVFALPGESFGPKYRSYLRFALVLPEEELRAVLAKISAVKF